MQSLEFATRKLLVVQRIKSIAMHESAYDFHRVHGTSYESVVYTGRQLSHTIGFPPTHYPTIVIIEALSQISGRIPNT